MFWQKQYHAFLTKEVTSLQIKKQKFPDDGNKNIPGSKRFTGCLSCLLKAALPF